ncbi:MAG: chitobiase/beta-hexosaminidase C-terminal domain-containing protein [Lachnospiraceae bacterium]|nr:chitobiase/beta-hexosaminidase C-terminal domain-containing protein [Lachnospiraceae bacterium]
MECPKCGNEIPEGKLYCPNCGYAVQIVPDYDPDLQENLESVGSDIAGNVNRIDVAESVEVPTDISSSTIEIPKVVRKSAGKKTPGNDTIDELKGKLVTIGVAIIFTIALIVAAIVLPKTLGEFSFIPQNAVDKAVSDGGTMNSMTLGPMDAAIDVSKDDEAISPTAESETEEASEPGANMGEIRVTPDGGTYSGAEYISAGVYYDGEESDNLGDIIYYTDDGTEPDTGSKVYKGKIPMPVGHSVYSFRYSNSAGDLSDTVRMEYDLEHTGACSGQDAANLIIVTLINKGALLDVYGHALGSIGTFTYRYDSMVRSGDGFYYLIPESYEEPGTAKHDTGNIYAVDADTLQTYKAGVGEGGQYNFAPFF